MGRHGESSPPSMMEVGVLILLILGFEQLSAAPPAVFDDYFEQDVKAVHLTQRGVIKACLPENKWTQLLAKFEAANTACEVGNENARFDWATLAKLNQGGDGDGNGVEFNLESAEGCLYRQLGWTDGTKLKAKNVKDDFTGLPSNIWNRLEVDLKECYNWNGEFQKTKKKKKKESKKEKSGSKSSEKSGGSGLEKEVYNQLWCADLAVEKALRRCAMQKIRGEE